MVEWLPSVGDFSAGALVALFVILVLVGRLVPRRSLDDMRDDRDYWRTAYEASQDARRLQDEALKAASVEIGKTAVELLEALRRAAGQQAP